jgi:hypothetical protein
MSDSCEFRVVINAENRTLAYEGSEISYDQALFVAEAQQGSTVRWSLPDGRQGVLVGKGYVPLGDGPVVDVS